MFVLSFWASIITVKFKRMRTKIFQRFIVIITITIGMITILHSCANRGTGPQGGPRDTTPPQLLSASQPNRATMVNNKQLEWVFDENILLEKPQENILISPPPIQMPTIRGVGKRLRVVLADSLKSNTTYTIDFGNAVVDLNEKNILENFNWSFTTGNTIDSMQISGTVIDALTLTPYEGIIVGVYTQQSDTAFTTTPFEYVARTNQHGKFTLRNIPSTTFSIYAIKNIPSSFYYDIVGKEIAFYQEQVSPSIVISQQLDSIFSNDEEPIFIKIDTIETKSYLPNDIILRLFKEQTQTAPRLRRAIRTSQESFTLLFSSPLQTSPSLHLLNDTSSNWLLQERTNRMDSLVYWINETNLATADTLKLIYSYQADSLISDTLSLSYRMPRTKDNKLAPSLLISSLNKTPLEIADTLQIGFNQPLSAFDYKTIMLEQRVDTLWKAISFTAIPDKPDCIKRLKIVFDKTPRATYRINIDSASITSIYGLVNEKYSQSFVTKSPEDYATLYVQWNILPAKGIVQLLDNREQIVQQQKITEASTVFHLVPPGHYFLRLIIDENENGKWDTGSLAQKIEPETVYYYPKRLVLRANWDSIEEWDYKSIPILQQRAPELPKSKK